MKKRRTLLKQRIMGIVLVLISVIIFTTEDGTAALLTLPLGLAMLLSKSVIIFED
jgi:hypothetical protein